MHPGWRRLAQARFVSRRPITRTLSWARRERPPSHNCAHSNDELPPSHSILPVNRSHHTRCSFTKGSGDFRAAIKLVKLCRGRVRAPVEGARAQPQVTPDPGHSAALQLTEFATDRWGKRPASVEALRNDWTVPFRLWASPAGQLNASSGNSHWRPRAAVGNAATSALVGLYGISALRGANGTLEIL
jgi:hypothetical protein